MTHPLLWKVRDRFIESRLVDIASTQFEDRSRLGRGFHSDGPGPLCVQLAWGFDQSSFLIHEAQPDMAALAAASGETIGLLERIPGTRVTTVERCAGHDGTWGVKAEYFENSMKIGRPVFRRMSEGEPDYVSSDCAIAARHILQGMGDTSAKKRHPLTLLRIAYGL